MGDIKKKSKEDWGLNKDMVERETNVERWKGNWVEDWLCLLLIRRKRLSSTTLCIDSLAWSKVTQKFQERMSFVIFYLLQESVPHCCVGGLLVEPPWARHGYQRASTWSATGYDVSAVDQKPEKTKEKRSEFCSTCIWTKHEPQGKESSSLSEPQIFLTVSHWPWYQG